MHQIFTKIKPDKIDDLVAINALVRPGPADAKMPERVNQRKNFNEEWQTDNKIIDDILGNTYGVILYQEQTTDILNKLGGFSLDRAEDIRREIIKYGKAKLQEHQEVIVDAKNDFINGAFKNRCDPTHAAEIWDNIAMFSRYGFSVNHAAPYSLIGYWMMFFKVYYPTIFFAASLSYENDKLKREVLKTEVTRAKIKFLPPDINRSDKDYIVTNGSIRIGLSSIDYVGARGIEEILNKRPFKSMEDFYSRINKRSLNKRAVQALIDQGAIPWLRK